MGLKLNGNPIFEKDTWVGSKIEHVFTPSAAFMDVEIFTDLYPEETYWELFKNGNDEYIAGAGVFEKAYTKYTTMVVRLKTDQEYTFVLYDIKGNGQSQYCAISCS